MYMNKIHIEFYKLQQMKVMISEYRCRRKAFNYLIINQYDFRSIDFNMFLNDDKERAFLISFSREFQNLGPAYKNVVCAKSVLIRGK